MRNTQTTAQRGLGFCEPVWNQPRLQAVLGCRSSALPRFASRPIRSPTAAPDCCWVARSWPDGHPATCGLTDESGPVGWSWSWCRFSCWARLSCTSSQPTVTDSRPHDSQAVRSGSRGTGVAVARLPLRRCWIVRTHTHRVLAARSPSTSLPPPPPPPLPRRRDGVRRGGRGRR